MDYPSEDRVKVSARSEDGQTDGDGAVLVPGDEPAAAQDESTEKIPEELPILPVRDSVVFPGTVVPLTIGREKSKRLIDDVIAGNKMLALFTQRQADTEDPGIDDVYRIGTVANVLKLLRMPDGGNTLLVHGVARAGLQELTDTDPYWKARINTHRDPGDMNLEMEALVYTARQTAQQIIELSPNVPEEAQTVLASLDKPGPLADFLAANLSLGIVQKQELLETFDVADRLRKVNATLNNQLEVLQLSQKIQSDVREQMDKSQREYYLQQQLKAIQKELGEGDAQTAELEALRERVERADMPDVVRKEADRELERLERISQAAPEYGVIRDYLDWLCALPWTKETSDNLDLERAQQILDEDHFGLEKIKRRIIEYLAVRKLNPEGRSPILCFVGPPGVGKTSLGQSIARALQREFIRISLGGVRDEADIRGHRRTYIGAIPGRLIQEIRKAGTRNPVFMLDELDKLGADFRGDPASALLEVLDPQQNHTFTDHYLGVPFDLSRAMFIGTANYMDPVAPALKDRMEVIELPGYTTAEKLEIAKRYLVKRQLRDNGIADRDITFSDETLRAIIEAHTREAGVRNLERAIGTVCRGIAAKVAREQQPDYEIEPDELTEYLGPPRFEPELAQRTSVPGVATGLAYTPVGGQIIFVEAATMPGAGRFALTGQIGDVMRESGQAALTLVRSRGQAWGVDPKEMAQTDIHIHVPAGGIPKDGPSAGVAMLTALVSLVTNEPSDPTVGMTGEITLRGLVLPIGGVKEKVLAAHRAGLKTVILPARNERDLHEVPQDVREEMRFVFANHVDEVLAAALPKVNPQRVTHGPRKKTSKAKKAKAGTKRTAKRSGTKTTRKSAATTTGKRKKSTRRKQGTRSTR